MKVKDLIKALLNYGMDEIVTVYVDENADYVTCPIDDYHHFIVSGCGGNDVLHLNLQERTKNDNPETTYSAKLKVENKSI